jgi:hypothetical protein
MRHQILRQLKDIQSLRRAGISTLPAEALLARMQATVDSLCAERDKRVGEQRIEYPGTNKVIKDRRCDCADQDVAAVKPFKSYSAFGFRCVCTKVT